MRLLHTADWHLGQKFMNQPREAEQGMALDWLLATIAAEQVDALIVAGDVFDVSNPPVSAEEQYYRFLTRLKDTGCRHVVIVGGNHDSPAKLNAPRGLLRALDMHVVGCAADDPAEEIVELRGADGQTEAIVAAVPFLRDRDFRFTAVGESNDERVRRIQAGIYEHYQMVAERAAERAATLPGRVPVIATGHLFAAGASATEEQHNIYIGNLENIRAEQFPEVFDYIALGHLHRAQVVGKQPRIRYCGSLLPLSFSERTDEKCVLIIDFDLLTAVPTVRPVVVPVFRRLLTLSGSPAELDTALQSAHRPTDPLPAWVELHITGETYVAGADAQLREAARDLHMDILKIRAERRAATLDETAPLVDLQELTPEEVFIERCMAQHISADKTGDLTATFRELQEWMAAQPD
jgi:DNA repair protein SbcD/Mre11